LRLIYKYEFMPKGIVNQASAELSRYITSDSEVWNNAVNFSKDNNNAQCQVVKDFYNRSINIEAKGNDARALMGIVMNALKDITDGYKGVSPEIFVPCTCSQCANSIEPTTFLYDKLIKWSKEKEHARVVCNESDTSLLIEELLYNVGLPYPRKEFEKKYVKTINKKIFISYSKHDKDDLNAFQDHLVTLKNEGLITFDCREIEFGKEWDEEIKQKLHECDIIVCLVSVKFLNTGYITKIEIPKAIEENKIIIPIIIKPCDWETSELGKYQAAQRGQVVSLDNNKKLLEKIAEASDIEKDAFWTEIIKEFRKKLFSK
jgi:internalin A